MYVCIADKLDNILFVLNKMKILLLVLFLIVVALVVIFILRKKAPDEKITIIKDVSYTKGFKLDVYDEKDKKKPTPAVILIHGGGLVKSDKNSEREVNSAKFLVENGATCFIPNYSLGKNSYPKSLYECINAIQYVRKNAKKYNIDPNDISVIGFSAGGLLAYLVGLLWDVKLPKVYDTFKVSALPKNVIVLYGIFNPLSRIYPFETVSKSGKTHKKGDKRYGHMKEVLGHYPCVSCNDKEIPHSKKRDPYCEDVKDSTGKVIEERKFHCLSDIWKEISPPTHLPSKEEKVFPKFLIVHGQQDRIVNYEQSLEALDTLKKNKIKVELVTIKEAPHGFDFFKSKAGNLSINLSKKILDFIN